MKIGIPKETKAQENRVALTPSGVTELVNQGHELLVQRGAGTVLGYTDDMYLAAGAALVSSAAEAFNAELVIKVKEPLTEEFQFLRKEQILFTYLHLAAAENLIHELLKKDITAIAYETVTDSEGDLPLLVPMSEVAGRLAAQAGATSLHMINGGRGVLMGGVPGVEPARVLVVGGGIVGTQAAKMALGLGADVTLLDINLKRLRQLDDLYGPRLKTRYSDASTLAQLAAEADVVIAAVLLPGRSAPKLITRQIIKSMREGSVLVDVAIDQGGCAETSRPTTHANPTYIVDGVVHYCVANIPSACARTATQALSNATLPYAAKIAAHGYQRAMRIDKGLMDGLNTCQGKITHLAVAESLGLNYTAADTLI